MRVACGCVLVGLCATPAGARGSPAPPPSGAAQLDGQVRERGTRNPLPYARIVAGDARGEELGSAEADAEGRYTIALARLPPGGRVRVSVSAPGHDSARYDETVAAGTRVELVYYLDVSLRARYETVVRGQKREEVSRTTISGDEVNQVAGTHGDPLRAVTNLPGIARAPFDLGMLVIWGSAPGDSSVLVGGHSIPQAFHFGVGTSVFNGHLLEKVDYLPGSFGVRHGRAIGGIIELTPRAGSTTGYHGYASLDLVDASVLVEGPIGKGSFAIGLRRSLIDLGLAAVGRAVDLKFTLAPSYWDYQAMLDYPILGGHWKSMFYGSFDQLGLVLDSAPVADPAIKGKFTTQIWFHALNLSWTRSWDRLEVEASASAGPQHTDFALGSSVGYLLDVFEIDARLEARWRYTRRLRLTWGFDLAADHYDAQVQAPYVVPEGGVQPPISATPSRRIAEGSWEGNPAFYVEARLQPLDRLTIYPGLRWDHFEGQGSTFDPRLSARLEVAPRTFLSGGVGLYHQPTPAPYADAKLGNPALGAQEAIHVSLGVESRPFAKLSTLLAKLTGFYKQLKYLEAESDEYTQREGKLVPAYYKNSGIGRIYGLEVLLRQDRSRYVWGWIAYTLSRSERRDQPGDPWRLFQYDQTHILTVVLAAHLPWALDAGLRLRYVTGNPDTPLDGGLYFADYDVYVAVPGRAFSTRQPDFFMLDLRLDKKFTFNRWAFSVYLDVSNVTNRANVDGYSYSYDYTKKTPVTGYPIFPTLGLKAAF